jgi:hypothetical protein
MLSAARNLYEKGGWPDWMTASVPSASQGLKHITDKDLRASASRPSYLAEFFPCFPQVLGVLFHTPCNLLCFLIATSTAMQGLRCFVLPSRQTPSYSRRHTSRVETPDGVWVYWRCNGRDEVSRVRDLSTGGVFIAAPSSRPVGTKARLDFLVQEGQIRTEAIVQHIEPGNGLGFKFTAVTEQDSQHLAALLTRLRYPPCSSSKL